MIKESAIAKTELKIIPAIKRIRKREKQIMIVISVNVAISLYLYFVDWSDKAYLTEFLLQCQFFLFIHYLFIHNFYW